MVRAPTEAATMPLAASLAPARTQIDELDRASRVDLHPRVEPDRLASYALSKRRNIAVVADEVTRQECGAVLQGFMRISSTISGFEAWSCTVMTWLKNSETMGPRTASRIVVGSYPPAISSA